ncbi:MAG: hypothetical protein IKR76_00480 [Ruminococcus sp.]|nr:hypothetical protein [Ruminococcus sp.]
MTNYSFLAEKCEKDIDIILKSGIMDEMEGRSMIKCPLVDKDIYEIDCLENIDIIDEFISSEEHIPDEFKAKPNYKDICKKCAFHNSTWKENRNDDMNKSMHILDGGTIEERIAEMKVFLGLSSEQSFDDLPDDE